MLTMSINKNLNEESIIYLQCQSLRINMYTALHTNVYTGCQCMYVCMVIRGPWSNSVDCSELR